jgi:hypothetical protein
MLLNKEGVFNVYSALMLSVFMLGLSFSKFDQSFKKLMQQQITSDVYLNDHSVSYLNLIFSARHDPNLNISGQDDSVVSGEGDQS